jgi:hypothetical protein
MALRILLEVLKNEFAEVDKAMFQWGERPNELNFRIQSIEKIFLDEIA